MSCRRGRRTRSTSTALSLGARVSKCWEAGSSCCPSCTKRAARNPAAGGRGAHRDGRSVEYSQLTHGQKLVKSIDDAPTTAADAWKVCGKPAAKVDGRAMVTGGHKFASDMKLPGMLFGKVLRPEKFG